MRAVGTHNNLNAMS